MKGKGEEWCKRAKYSAAPDVEDMEEDVRKKKINGG